MSTYLDNIAAVADALRAEGYSVAETSSGVIVSFDHEGTPVATLTLTAVLAEDGEKLPGGEPAEGWDFGLCYVDGDGSADVYEWAGIDLDAPTDEVVGWALHQSYSVTLLLRVQEERR